MDTPKQTIQKLATRGATYTNSMAIRQCGVRKKRHCNPGHQLHQGRSEDGLSPFLHLHVGSIIELRPDSQVNSPTSPSRRHWMDITSLWWLYPEKKTSDSSCPRATAANSLDELIRNTKRRQVYLDRLGRHRRALRKYANAPAKSGEAYFRQGLFVWRRLLQTPDLEPLVKDNSPSSREEANSFSHGPKTWVDQGDPGVFAPEVGATWRQVWAVGYRDTWNERHRVRNCRKSRRWVLVLEFPVSQVTPWSKLSLRDVSLCSPGSGLPQYQYLPWSNRTERFHKSPSEGALWVVSIREPNTWVHF